MTVEAVKSPSRIGNDVDDHHDRDQILTIKKSLAEVVIYLLLIAVDIFYLSEAYRLHVQVPSPHVGPGGFPLIIAVINLLLLLGLLFISLFIKPRRTPQERLAFSRPLSVLAAVAILIAETTLLKTAGPLITIALFSFLLMWVAGERRLTMLAIIPPLFSATIYAIFVMALGVYFD
ncbi:MULTISPECIES: tripartite tricarboxylate transporter TctB family protein [unclassified Salinicola]|uniref:tripartite tricarboxylate transporter TctB family protein n=1 Tax=unclassified Salinicola TaxID=2634022 RepID=UPI000DA2014D|nr:MULTISPECIES: tripartite tricarboxylate transporter TctB family protein [unclassified Salinicola]